MNKKLAIIGHPLEGDKVIEILKMLGGRDVGYNGLNSQYYYYIDEYGNIAGTSELPNNKILFVIYTLKEFLEKFPYKVGDKVIIKCKNQKAIVDKVVWCCDTITYWLKYNGFIEGNWRTKHLQPYKEKTMEKEEENFSEGIEKTMQECLFGKEENIEEIKIDIPKSYEFSGVDDDNQKVVFTKIQPQYPKTYKECCDVLNIDSNRIIEHPEDHLFYEEVTCYENGLLLKLAYLRKLLICRDAYRKLAGEQIGLGKPWEPEKMEIVYAIFYNFREDIIDVSVYNLFDNVILCFPTEEMRDVFYENFKDLIENCKELL